MNSANALGFFAMGVAMWVLPLAAPGLFPPTAIDGSSTRAIWLQLMGIVQAGLGVSYLISCYMRGWASSRPEPLPRGATATADWQGGAMPKPVLAVSFAESLGSSAQPPVVAFPSTVTLEGEHAALWQALHQALRADANVRRLAHRVVTLVRRHQAPVRPRRAGGRIQPDPFAVLPFLWSDKRAQEPAA